MNIDLPGRNQYFRSIKVHSTHSNSTLIWFRFPKDDLNEWDKCVCVVSVIVGQFNHFPSVILIHINVLWLTRCVGKDHRWRLSIGVEYWLKSVFRFIVIHPTFKRVFTVMVLLKVRKFPIFTHFVQSSLCWIQRYWKCGEYAIVIVPFGPFLPSTTLPRQTKQRN